MPAQLNGYEFNDFTDQINLIPNNWGLLQQLGIFSRDSSTSKTLQFDETANTLTLIKDQPRGTRKQVNRENYSKLHTVGIPHFPFDDVIRPQDVIDKRKAGSTDAMAETDARMAKQERIRRSWAATSEYARMQALMGNVYNPNNTNDVQSWFTEMNVAQTTVNFQLSTPATDVLAKGEEALAASQDNIMSGEMVSNFVSICSPEFFSALIKHDSFKDAYSSFRNDRGVNPLRDRAGSALGAQYRQFSHGGIDYVEYRGSFADETGAEQRIVPVDEAYLVPMGTSDTFVTYYAPSDRFEYIGTAGLDQYMFEFPDGKGHLIELESESNFLNMVRRPKAVIKLTRV